MSEPLVTGRFVRLCELADDDTPFVVGWRNDRAIGQWLPSATPVTVESHRRWLAACRSRGDLVLAYRDMRGRICGQGSLYGIDVAQRSAEFGRLFFAPGLAHPFTIVESYYLTHRVGFEVLGLTRIHSATVTANSRAERLLLCLGYQCEADQPGAYVTPWGEVRDVRVYGLTPEFFKMSTLERWLYRTGPPDVRVTDIERLATGQRSAIQ